MRYKLKAYSIYELGQRDNQEDSLFPGFGEIKDSDRLFILCDGMGGHSSGEVASSTVCEALSQAILENNPDIEGPFSDDEFRAALAKAYDALDAKDNGAAKKMGTTMTFLKLHSEGCTIAHIGDSRVYHVRPGKDWSDTQILFQTVDHSLVNDLVKIGEMTPEEAKTSKQKNVITRAMQPCMERRSRADIYHTSDIQPGDFFMLCSDGILEQMEDQHIQHIFSQESGSDLDKVDLLTKVTNQNRDNHTAIIVHITDVIDPIIVDGDNDEPDIVIIPNDNEVSTQQPNFDSDSHKDSGSRRFVGVTILLIILLIGFFALRLLPLESNNTEKKAQPVQQNVPTKPSAMDLKDIEKQLNIEIAQNEKELEKILEKIKDSVPHPDSALLKERMMNLTNRNAILRDSLNSLKKLQSESKTEAQKDNVTNVLNNIKVEVAQNDTTTSSTQQEAADKITNTLEALTKQENTNTNLEVKLNP